MNHCTKNINSNGSFFHVVKDDINMEIDQVSTKLDTSQMLQTKFDMWAGNWLGRRKGQAMKEATREITQRHQEDQLKIREVFQHERFDTLTRTWKRAGMVLCTNTSMSCEDAFDPYIQANVPNSSWKVDYSLTGIDAEGWTYAFDFLVLNKNGAGDSAPKWNSYVRRRKWRYSDKQSGGAAVDEYVSHLLPNGLCLL